MPTATGFINSSFYLETLTQKFESPLTRKTQRLELQAQRWVANWTLPPMTRANAAQWIAFFLKLKGQINTFTASDPDWQTNLGAWSGTPLVKGGSQTGNTLLIDGCNTSVTGWAKAGDYFNVNSKLYRITTDCNSNGSGEVTLAFEPPIYNSPADNAPLTCNPATASMILISDNLGEWNSGLGFIYDSKTFAGIEAL
jgi:hypothetical protein